MMMAMVLCHLKTTARSALLGIAILHSGLHGQEKQEDAQLDKKLEGLYHRQQFDDAEKLLAEHLKKSPDDNDRRIELSGLLNHLGKSEKSIKILQEGIRKKESDNALWWHLGQIWLARGEDGPNVSRSGGSVTYHPSKMTDEEEVAWKKKEYEKAVKAFRTLLKRNPNHSGSAEMLVESLQGALPPEKLSDEIETLANKFPENLQIALAHGDVLMTKKSPKKAIELYLRLLKTSPRNELVH